MTIRYILITWEGIKGSETAPPNFPECDNPGHCDSFEDDQCICDEALQKWKDDCVLFEDQEKARVEVWISNPDIISGTIILIPPLECEVVEQWSRPEDGQGWLELTPHATKMSFNKYRRVLRIK